MHCSWELKKNYFIKFLSPLSFKKYFLFLSFSLSGFSSFSFFLLNFFFFPSSTLCFADLFWVHLHRHPTSPTHLALSFIANLYLHHRPTLPSHAADPSRPILHCRSSSSSSSHVTIPRRRPISPNPPSHCQSKLHCRPKFHRRSKLHWHRLHRTQERRGFRGWISWLSLDFVVANWLDFMVVVGGCSWLAVVVDLFVVFLL